MKAALIQPLRFAVTSQSGWLATNPVSNTDIDHPGLVARSSANTATFTVNLGSTQMIDTVAVIGSNLPASATITVTAGSYNSGATPAYVGVKDAAFSTKSVLQFSGVTTSTVTVSITSNAPIEFQRLVIGKRIETDGIDDSCEQTSEDLSVFNSGPGYQTVEKYAVLPVWKAKMSWITQEKWRTEMNPFFMRVGTSTAILFMPISDDATLLQDAIFGRISGNPAKGEHATGRWLVSFAVTGLAA